MGIEYVTTWPIYFLLAYIVGSFPTAAVWVRIRNGTDIGEVGSGNVGASNVTSNLGTFSGIIVGSFDFMKGMFPSVFLSISFPDNPLVYMPMLLLIVGHNWSIFLRFKGGRGVLTALGVISGAFMWREVLVLCVGPGIIGRGIIYKDSGVWTLVSLVALIIMVSVSSSDIYLNLFAVGVGGVLLIKRLLSNEGLISLSKKSFKTIWFRILFDRDIREKDDWISGHLN